MYSITLYDCRIGRLAREQFPWNHIYKISLREPSFCIFVIIGGNGRIQHINIKAVWYYNIRKNTYLILERRKGVMSQFHVLWRHHQTSRNFSPKSRRPGKKEIATGNRALATWSSWTIILSIKINMQTLYLEDACTEFASGRKSLGPISSFLI